MAKSIIVHPKFLDSKIHDEDLTQIQRRRLKDLRNQVDDIPELSGIVLVGASAQRQWDSKLCDWVPGECLWIAATTALSEFKLLDKLPDTVTVQVNVFKHDNNGKLAAKEKY